MNNEDGYGNGNAGHSPAIPLYGRRPNLSGGPADRLPPHHEEAEKSVLGAILRDETSLAAVVDFLRVEHFFRSHHQVIFTAILSLYEQSVGIDDITVSGELARRNQLEEIGGVLYLFELMETVPHSANAEYHARIVQETGDKREVLDAGLEMTRDAQSSMFTADEVRERALARISRLESAAGDGEQEPAFTPLPSAMDPKAFYGIAGEVVRIIAPHTEACPEAILGQFLVAYANAFGPRPRWQLEATIHRCNLYLLLVGPTGIARKGTSWDVTQWLLNRCDDDAKTRRTVSGLTSGEGLIAYCDQAGAPILAVETEFVRLLTNMGRENNSLSSVLRQAFDGPRLEVATKNNPIVCNDSYFSLIGHTTQSDYKAKIHQVSIDNGLVNRMMHMNVYRARRLPEGGDFESVRQALEPLTADLALSIGFAKFDRALDRPMRKTEAARVYWSELYHGPLSEPRTGDHAKVTIRAAPIILRIAVIFAVLDRDYEIDVRHIEAARAFWDYCDQTSAFLFPCRAVDADGARVLKAIDADDARTHGLTPAEISRRAFGGHKTRPEMVAILSLLNEAGLICHEPERKGRACSVWKRTHVPY
jgi:hypothetical protein